MQKSKSNKKILIAGGSGLIGTELSMFLTQNGYEVAWLSRNKKPKSNFKTFLWNPDKGEIDISAFNEVVGIINLCGASIADKRWTNKRKKVLRESRIKPTELLVRTIKSMNISPACFIQASATGYYGFNQPGLVREDTPPRKDFFSSLVSEWEDSTKLLSNQAIRTVILRFGIVLSPKGGFLTKLFPSLKWMLAPYFGNGQQYNPWIHIEDICRGILFAIENNQVNGIYNLTSPDSTTQKRLTKIIRDYFRPGAFLIGVPSWFLSIVFGELSKALLSSLDVRSDKFQSSGFSFKYDKVEKAIEDLEKKT